MLALVRCYGVEGLASRVINTTRLLQLATLLVLTLEAQPTTQANSRALISLLRTESAGLVSALNKERDAHAATTQSLANERSRYQPPVQVTITTAQADALKSEANTLRNVAGRLSSEKFDLQDQLLTVTNNFAELQRKHDATLQHVRDLEVRLSSTSASKLMDFIACGTMLGGHWKWLHQLLRLYRDGSPIPPALRTPIQVSARDKDTDDIGPTCYRLTLDLARILLVPNLQFRLLQKRLSQRHRPQLRRRQPSPSSLSEISQLARRGGFL